MDAEQRRLRRKEVNRAGIERWRKARSDRGLIPVHNLYINPEYEPLYLALHRWTQDEDRNFQSLINEMMVLNAQLTKKIPSV